MGENCVLRLPCMIMSSVYAFDPEQRKRGAVSRNLNTQIPLLYRYIIIARERRCQQANVYCSTLYRVMESIKYNAAQE